MKMPTTFGSSIDVRGSLEEATFGCTDQCALYELLDKKARVGAPSDKLDSYLRRFIEVPVPYLTAKVFGVYRHTGSRDLSVHAAAASICALAATMGIGMTKRSIASAGRTNFSPRVRSRHW